MNRWLLLAVAASVGLSACSKKEGAAAPEAAVPQNVVPATPVPVAEAIANSGKVVQLEQGAGYTYAEVESEDGRKVWIAGAQIEVKPGDVVEWGSHAVMQNFTAKSLNRTFDEILFVNAWGPAGSIPKQVAPHGTQTGGQAAPQMGAQHPPMAQAGHPPMQQQGGMAAVSGDNVGELKSVVNAGGYSYMEVLQNGATVWVAAPEAQLTAGEKVTWDAGMVMRNFTAKSINRTFDEIVFAGAARAIK